MKKKNITYRQIEHALVACKFNPSEPGPLKIITEVENPAYYERRAIEFIQVAQESISSFTDEINDYTFYNDCIIKAVRLLILAKEYRNNNKEK